MAWNPKEVSIGIIEQAIEEFDLIEFLQDENIDYTTEGKNIGADWVGINPCPNCDDSRNHFAMNLSTKSGNCWVCSYSPSLIQFISNIKRIPYSEAIEFILSETGISDEDIEMRVTNILQGRKKSEPKEEDRRKEIKLPRNVDITSELIKKNPIINRFFKERGLFYRHVREYHLKIGIDSLFRGKLLIPVIFKRSIVAYQARNMVHKHYHSEGPIKETIYNYDRIPRGSTIILVEGFFDFVRTEDFVKKYFGNKYEVTTPFSKIITPPQIDLIHTLDPDRVIYMLDRDSWFDFNKSAYRFMVDTDYLILPPKKDPGSMSEREMIQLFHENSL